METRPTEGRPDEFELVDEFEALLSKYSDAKGCAVERILETKVVDVDDALLLLDLEGDGRHLQLSRDEMERLCAVLEGKQDA